MNLGTGRQICMISHVPCEVVRDIDTETGKVFTSAGGRKTLHGCSTSIRSQVPEMQKFRDLIMQGDYH